MAKQNKGSKQASMLSFFTPKKPGEELDVFAADAEAKNAESKRPRASVEPEVTAADAKTETESKPKVPQGKMKGKTKPKPKAKAKGKAKASTKAKAKPKKKRQTRGISPHFAAGDESDEDEDLSDDEAFNTPEAKRARAELETGGEVVPAGAIISDDAIVEGTDIVDVSAEEAILEIHTNREAEEKPAQDEDVNGEAVMDLAAPNSADDEPWTENGDKKKTRGKATAAKTSKAAIKNPTKRQAKMKEKAVAEAKTVPVEPLDPAVQARVDTYKLKMEELTRQYTELLTSKQNSDAVMQEIYGAALDRDLDINVDTEKSQQGLAETWQKLQDHVNSSASTTDSATLSATVEFPHEVKCLVAKDVQGRTASLSVIASDILASFKKALRLDVIDLASTEESNSSETKSVDSSVLLALEMEIKMLAQRTPHGVRPGKSNVFEDTSVDALWTWEIGSVDKYFGDEAQKVIKRMRKHRKRLGQQLKTLARVVQLLHQKPVDEAKVSAEEAKVGKFGLVIDAELQKAKDREAKEEERRSAAEERKRHGMERQQAKEAKEAEKKKREREEEDSKKKVLNKRLKVFQKLFTSAPGTSDSTIDGTDDQATDKTKDSGESKSAEMDRIDAAISFLSSSGDAFSFSAEGAEPIISSLKSQRDSDRASDGCWSARRHRDPKLGVMKLLQFYENNRPAYYGTFNSKKRLLRAGRRPLTHYAEFDYSVDSDDEWEEEEPGESLSDDENDAEDIGGDDLDYGDDWLAYEDDVEYMDDVATEDRGDETVKHKKKRVKVKALKAVQPAKLEPQIIGPFWYSGNASSDCTDKHVAGLAGELLCEPVFESTLMRKAREYKEEQKRLEAVRQEQQRKKELQEEKEKLKAQEAKQKLEAAANQPTQSTPAKAVPQKKTSPGKMTPAKATPVKVTPQKSKAQKTPSKPSPSPAKSVSASPSPAKPPPIDSFFKKVAGPVSVPPKRHDLKSAADEQQKPKDGKVDVISVD
ncbi:Chromatin assembly factor 1 subunit FAS1 [Phytophthora citrophthora]|uniref:Chromatin assembly factor 1 subunit FAS1 n=1 Tax=Phytophthora citrophthora TaxID=4793 RepID=A0AAD9G0W8_9STRA|nr:Chromatin assembly factor 1 subunit FAS1 [Phytophthora citrophthora]